MVSIYKIRGFVYTILIDIRIIQLKHGGAIFN